MGQLVVEDVFAKSGLGLQPGLVPLAVLAALDEADTYGGHQDVVLCQVFGEALGDGYSGGAGDGCGHRVCAGGSASQVGHVDDAAAADLAHLRDGLLDKSHRAPDLQLEVELPVLLTHLLEPLGHRGASVVDQDVQSAKPVQGSLYHPLGGVGAGYVGGDGDNRALGGGPDFLGGLVEHFLPAGHDDDVSALFGHAEGRSPADAVATAGNYCYFVLKSKVHGTNS